MQNNRAERCARHAAIRDAHHVSDALGENLARERQISDLKKGKHGEIQTKRRLVRLDQGNGHEVEHKDSQVQRMHASQHSQTGQQ